MPAGTAAKAAAPSKVYLPKGFDDDDWRRNPIDWLPELVARDALPADGSVEFHVAEIVGAANVDIDIEGDIAVQTPPGTNFVVLTMEGEAVDQGDTVEEIVTRLRVDMKDWDWPMECHFVFWHHRQFAMKMKLQFAVAA
jgi:hypothetical protein